ncbi:MAG TPA: lysine--tRNA ligase [Bryobacterales bacterium]|nr:lysine--tRNA ligase [Bryobacterales bacterium]
MSFEHELLEQRYQKIRQLEELGFTVYPRKFAFTHALGEIVSQYGQATAEELAAARVGVKVCGRLLTVRRQGKAGFAHILQGGDKLQIYVRQDAVGEQSFNLYKMLDAGDIIGAEGYLFRTRTNELTVHVERLEFLSKALLALPEKWHGLQDVEIRYRQRYLDLISNPEVRRVFVRRAKIIAALRRALEARGYIEVETPMMQPLYGGAIARPFRTHHNALDIDLYLRIAPELYLKRLVVGGLDRVFEINRNFRNEGISTQHNPEFTMLEFYQAYSDYRDLMDFSEELLRAAATAAGDGDGETVFEYGEHRIDFSKLTRLSMKEALVEMWPNAATRPSVANLAGPDCLAGLVAEYNATAAEPITLPPGATPGESVGLLFEHICEPRLIQPTVIYDFPVEVSPLSKNKPDDPAWVERFEIYAAGMEIANAYSELNDPQEQRRRFQLQAGLRERGDQETHEMDEDYLRALCYAMPPTAGEGIGIDRLTMLLTNSKSIRDVILFPLLRPETSIGIADQLQKLDR